MTDLHAEAARIIEARRTSQLLAPAADRPTLTLDEAYAVQALVLQAREAAGERLVGWKLGHASLALRAQRGIPEPNRGPLTDAMQIAEGATLPTTLMQTRIEPEVALRFARDVEPGADRAAVLAAVASAHACLEVVDTVWPDYSGGLTGGTADLACAAGFVLGPELPLACIDTVEVSVFTDDQPCGSGVGSNASGHPADGVVWLASHLAQHGHRLRAGDIVLTGNLARAVPIPAGSTVRAVFSEGGRQVSVSVRA